MTEKDPQSAPTDRLETERPEGLKKAEETLGAIERHVHEVNPGATPGEVDAAVADFVDHTDKQSGVDPDKRLLGVETGALEILADPSAHMTALEIGQAPVDTLGIVLGELSPEQASAVIGVIDEAEHDLLNHEAAPHMDSSVDRLAIDNELTGAVTVNDREAISVNWVEDRGKNKEGVLSPFGPGTNPDTGNFDVRFMPRSSDIDQNLIHDRVRSGVELPVREGIRSGRDQVVESLDELKLLPDRVYRATDPAEVLSLVAEGDLVSRTERDEYIESEGGKNNNLGIDWYLGGAAPRYGAVFLEAPARPDYVGPKHDNGVRMASGGYVRHFHSSGGAHPIPAHAINIIALADDGKYARMTPQAFLEHYNQG